jgi:hypothetical protein
MSSRNPSIRDGLLVGLIAAIAVAVFYAFFDLVAARGALHTVDLLGKAVFRGERDPAILQLPIQPDLQAITLYNALHLVISLTIGLVVTSLVDYAERHPDRARAVLAVLVGGFVVTIGVVGALTVPFRPLLPWWSIVLANLLAVLWAGAFLARRRPGVARRLLSGAPSTPVAGAGG